MQFKFWWKTYRSTSLWHKNLSIQVSPSQNNVIRKQDKKRIIWTQNGQKEGDRIFLRAWCLNKKCREWSNPYKYGILAKTNEAISRKWQKNSQKHLIWTQNGQKTGDRIFFWAWCPNKKCREYYNLLKYEISAKNNEAISRNRRKTAKNPYFGHKMLNNLDTHFFFKNRASSLFYIWNRLTCCKKSEKTNGGKYENFCDGRTDRLTDGGYFKGPKCWSNKRSSTEV